ncbi:MAG: cardiolipin synthase, partial [Deltaproteobacteria bacterium]
MEDTLFYSLMGFLQLVLALMGGLHAMLYKRSPRSAALWIVICCFVPFLGPLAYAVLGVNRTQRRAVQRKLRSGLGRAVALEREAPVELPASFHSLFRLTNRISEFPLTEGNQIEPLYDGDEAFPRMIEAIDGARRSVTCCSYIFDNDAVGHRFIEAFGRAVKRGVRVHLLIDGVGGYRYFSRVYRELQRCGATPASFAPLGLTPSRLVYLNLRNHRKILVVDGRIGFTGGMNISARHLFAGRDPKRAVADVQFRIEGPVV